MARIITPEVTNGMKKIHESLVKLARDNKKKDKEIERLKNEMEVKNGLLTYFQRSMEDLLAEFNKQQSKLNIMECRYETIVKVIKTLDVKPSDDNTDNICPICMDTLGAKKVRSINCLPHHSICPSCFAALCASSDDPACPLCRSSLEDGDLVIE